MLAHRYGDHMLAAQAVAKKFKQDPNYDGARVRAVERLILDTWISFCLKPPTSEALQIMGRLQSQGIGIGSSRYGGIVLDKNQMKKLIELARKTNATMPESWIKTPPGASRAFCVQTRPHTIDRILIMNAKGNIEEIVWYAYAAGFCSLIGLQPGQPRLLAADIDTAQRLQHDLASLGRPEEIACVHLDLFRGDTCPRWDAHEHLLTAIPRHCDAHSKPAFFGPDDIVRLQNALDQFPGVERSVRGLPVDHVMHLLPREQAVAWPSLRFAMIAGMIPPGVSQVPPAASSIFEQTGTKVEDAAALVAYFSNQGRQQLVEDIEKLSRTRNIARDNKFVVKETATDYRVVKGADSALLANFNLHIVANVTFRNHRADRYCQATLRCGKAILDVLFPQNLLNDRVQSLEGELQRQITVADLVSTAGKMPTVIEINKFRQFIVPYLRKQAATAKPIRGVDMLGWSENRKSFTFPGFVVNMDGAEPTSQILCPSVAVLARYKASALSTWADSCPTGLLPAFHDIIAMLVASSVRYFRRCATQPIMIAQSSSAMTILDRISVALGQHEIHALNQNAREGNRVEGVHGYPLLAAGPRTVGTSGSQTPYLHLTDTGYTVANVYPDVEQAAAGGRAAQYCLRKVVEWCLSTGGDMFREIPSVTHYGSLLREGKWLIEHVCGLKDWTVSRQKQTALEKLLAQIPYEEAGRRMTLIDGQDLHIDIRGLTRDHDGILREARDMGTLAAIEGDKLVSPAVRLLPAISTYYAQEPDVTVIAT